MSERRPRIAFVYNTYSTFIQLDEMLLSRYFDVDSLYIKNRRPSFLLDLWYKIKDADAIVVWFASWHTLPAFMMGAMRGIPRILITGGYDVANEPDIGYGLRGGGFSKFLGDRVFNLTTLALPFSETAHHETLKNTPLLPNKIKLVMLGVPDQALFSTPSPKERIVLTVAHLTPINIKRKNIVLVIQAAEHLPDLEFIVVGRGDDATLANLRQIAPPNVTLTGFLSDDDLTAIRQKAMVYVQASHHEGFGLALAESMLARAVPVVSRYGSMPEVVADAGVYLDHITPETITKGVESALQQAPVLGEKARHRILTHFPLHKRGEALRTILHEVLA